MDRYSANIGRIHPAFFKHSTAFSRFRKTFDEKGDVFMQSPFFTLEYNFSSGDLFCDDKDVLLDFVDIIQSKYGSSVPRETIYDSVEWSSIKRDWSILNVGVVIIPDNDTGWDGSPNSIWFDSEVPGVVVSVNHQFWSTKALHGAWKLETSDIQKLGGQATLPNLVDALVLTKGHKARHSKIEKLISSVYATEGEYD